MTFTEHPLTPKILFGRSDHVGWIIFNNPDRHNAIGFSMWQAIAALTSDFDKDPDIRVVVTRGAGGKAYVSGADISEFDDKRGDKQAIEMYNQTSKQATDGLQRLSKPTIAMIEGYCIGGGLALALACDIRIAAQNSRFGVPAAKLGLGYEYEGVKTLMDIVGPSFAKEIFYTARQFNAVEAAQMGLVNRVVATEELNREVLQYAHTIVENAPLTISSIKTIVAEALKEESRRDRQLCDKVVNRCFASSDYIEGRQAFMQKRKPVFLGK
uniref:enoyl-CoA hydratase n=1 Tax=Orrella sp. TaxID=1921583 RepID=UPI00404876EB